MCFVSSLCHTVQLCVSRTPFECMGLASLTTSHCSALRLKAAVPFYVPCRVVATLQCSALRVKAAIHFFVPRLLATSNCVGSRRSILCASFPDDVTLLGSACEGSNSILCTSPPKDVTKLDSVCNYCKGHRSSLSATRYVSLPLAILSRESLRNKRHLPVSPT